MVSKNIQGSSNKILKKEPADGQKNISSGLLIMIFLACLAGILVLFYLSNPYSPSVSTTPPLQNKTNSTTTNGITYILDVQPSGFFLGSDNAPVSLVEFYDYACPYCKQFHSFTEKSLFDNYVDQNKIKIYFKAFPRTNVKNSLEALVASRCALAQGKFLDMHNLLYEKQGEFMGGTPSIFSSYAESLGLNRTVFEACVSSDDMLSSVLADKSEATKYGVPGTPTLFIIIKNGSLSQESIQKIHSSYLGFTIAKNNLGDYVLAYSGFIDYPTLKSVLDLINY